MNGWSQQRARYLGSISAHVDVDMPSLRRPMIAALLALLSFEIAALAREGVEEVIEEGSRR